MKAIMIKMTIFMGVIMSFVLSLVGTLLGGHFTVVSWLISFAISFVISLIIGFAVPIKKLGDMACNKFNVIPESLKGTLISAIISDLIYTPIITIIMVTVMLKNAVMHLPPEAAAHAPTVGQVLPLSLIVCLLVGYVVIVIVQPLLIKTLIRKK